jgi:hypothetical protein
MKVAAEKSGKVMVKCPGNTEKGDEHPERQAFELLGKNVFPDSEK